MPTNSRNKTRGKNTTKRSRTQRVLNSLRKTAKRTGSAIVRGYKAIESDPYGYNPNNKTQGTGYLQVGFKNNNSRQNYINRYVKNMKNRNNKNKKRRETVTPRTRVRLPQRSASSPGRFTNYRKKQSRVL